MTALVIRGDARHLPLPDETVDLIVTSPPYFALRSYSDTPELCERCRELLGQGWTYYRPQDTDRNLREAWPDWDAHVAAEHKPAHYQGQIGSEPTPQEFLEALWECTAEMMRVLKPSGSAFINLGDKYGRPGGGADVNPRSLAGAGKGATQRTRTATDGGGRDKSLMLLPERYRIGCVDRLGLIARAVIVWDKPNGLPESVQDRVRRSHEDWVHLTKQPRYYSAVDEIREEQVGGVITGSGAKRGRGHGGNMLAAGTFSKDGGFNAYREQNGVSYNPLGKLPGSVWTIKDESSLARFVLEAVKSGSLSLDEGERIWTGRPAYGQRSPAILTDAGNGSESSTGTATDDTGRPPKVTDEHTDSSTNSPSDSSPMDSLSTTPATTQISTASEASPAHTADASTQHTLSQSPSQPTSHDEHGKITAPQAISTTNQTPTSVQAEGASAEPVWLREAANIAEHTAPPSVWKVATEPLTVPDHLGIEHFAAYPTEWPKRLIRGWSPPGICLECGEGRRPVSVATLDNTGYRNGPGGTHTLDGRSGQTAHRGTLATVARHLHSILGYVCACTPHTDHPGTGERYFTGGGNRGLNTTSGTRIPHVARGDDGHVPKVGPWREYHFDQWTPAPTRPAVILDPFSGTGTTTLVASALGRIGIGVDLSHDYGRLAQWRTTDRAQIAKVLEVPKPPVIPQAQTAFDFGDAS